MVRCIAPPAVVPVAGCDLTGSSWYYPAFDFAPTSGPFPPGLYAVIWGSSSDCSLGDEIVRMEWPVEAERFAPFAQLPGGWGRALYARFGPGRGCFAGDLYIGPQGYANGPCPQGGAILRLKADGSRELLVTGIEVWPGAPQLAIAADGRRLYFTAVGERRVYELTSAGPAIDCPPDLALACGDCTDPSCTGGTWTVTRSRRRRP